MIEERAKKIADLLLKVNMTKEELSNWLGALPKMSKEQLDELTIVLDKEVLDLEAVRVNSREELAKKIELLIKDKY